MMETLEARYRRLLQAGADISEHLPTLYELALWCPLVMEIGVRYGTSATALLRAKPAALTLVDINPCTQAVADLNRLRGPTTLKFIQGDSRKISLRKVDMLHVDGEHTYECLREELFRHGPHVSKYIAIHDTELFPALAIAILEFMASHPFKVLAHYKNNNGMTILRRLL